MRALDAAWLGETPYGRASVLQSSLQEARREGRVGDTLVQLTHPHVYTIGRRGSPDDVLWDAEELAARGVEVVETDRGGQVTYHGPGQLVGYPVIDLGPGADLVAYLRDLEEVLIRVLAGLGVEGVRVPGLTGVWVGLSKVAAIGVRVTGGVTKHGFALNVSPDLDYFGGIVPCGISDRGVTSVEAVRGAAPPVEEVARSFEERFAEVFGYRVRRVEADALLTAPEEVSA